MRNDAKSRQHPTPQPKDPDLQPHSYEVGYKRPPLGTRFQPGQSGNPRGRPKGSINYRPDPPRKLSEVVREESKRPVNLQQGGQTITLPSDQAVVRSITARAIQGNPSAQKSFLLLQKELNAPEEFNWSERLAILVAYKNGWREVFADFKRRRMSPPLPDPLPERIEIDEDNRTAYLLDVAEASSGECSRTARSRRKLGAEDYDWLRRHIPDTDNNSVQSPQPLLTRDELNKLPHHMRMALWLGLKGVQDLQEGKFVHLKPPRPMYNSNFVTPCGREMPLHGMRCYPVEADDAEILLSQGWTIVDQDE